MESSLLRCGVSSSGISQLRARSSASTGRGDIADGHARVATPPLAASATPRAAAVAAKLQAGASQGFRDGDIEKVWTHGTKLPGQGFICGYCKVNNKGGGATRLRDHLGGIVGEVKACNSVPRTLRDPMRELRKTSKDNKRERAA